MDDMKAGILFYLKAKKMISFAGFNLTFFVIEYFKEGLLSQKVKESSVQSIFSKRYAHRRIIKPTRKILKADITHCVFLLCACWKGKSVQIGSS